MHLLHSFGKGGLGGADWSMFRQKLACWALSSHLFFVFFYDHNKQVTLFIEAKSQYMCT